MLTLYSDSGKPCVCGSTIYRYEIHQERSNVDTFCYTCHASNYFIAENKIETPAQASQEHRAS